MSCAGGQLSDRTSRLSTVCRLCTTGHEAIAEQRFAKCSDETVCRRSAISIFGARIVIIGTRTVMVSKHGSKVMPCGKTHGTRQTTAYNHATWQTTRGGAKRYNNAARRHPVALYFTSSASAAAGEQLITIIVLALPPSTGCTGAAQRYPECSYA